VRRRACAATEAVDRSRRGVASKVIMSLLFVASGLTVLVALALPRLFQFAHARRKL
jgi:hypothetical protein